MLKHLYFTILLTFIVGITSGVYAYFLTREDTRPILNTDTYEPTPQDGYEIVAYAYGGCERIGCASLRIIDDGSYTYLASTRAGEYERYTDMLTPRQYSELTDLVDRASLVEIKETPFVGTCPITYDGIAYRFTIRRTDEQYSFDSCAELLDGEELFATLIQYFAIMDATYQTP
jgi:hypothetical protein